MVLQQIPLDKIVLPPLFVIVPPEVAVVVKIFDIELVLNTGVHPPHVGTPLQLTRFCP